MLQVIALILLLCFAFHTSTSIERERKVFAEVGEPTAVKWLIWLVPIPFALPFLDRGFWYLFFPVPIGAMFFVPAILVAATGRRKFDISRHPGAKASMRVLDNVVTFGIMGILDMCVFTLWLWLHRH